MTEPHLEFPTSLGTSDADHIRLLGLDLANDLMGQVGFGELAFWLVTLRRCAMDASQRPGSSTAMRGAMLAK